MHKSIPIFLILLCQTPVERKLVSAQDHSFHVFQQDGVTIAETKGGPKYTEELFSYELVLTLQSDEREESLLTNPMQFLSDQNGSFYVADWSEKRIAVFNSEGIFSHSIGRQESGPGEISGWPTIMSIQNGIVGVYDFSLRRFTRFGTDGSLLDATRIPDDAQSIILDFYPVSDVTSLCINRIGGNDRVNEYVQIARYAQSGQLVWSQTFDEVKVSYSVYGEFEHLPNPIRMLYQYGAQPIALIHHKLGISLIHIEHRI